MVEQKRRSTKHFFFFFSKFVPSFLNCALDNPSFVIPIFLIMEGLFEIKLIVNECARTDTVFLHMSEVCDGTVSFNKPGEARAVQQTP